MSANDRMVESKRVRVVVAGATGIPGRNILVALAASKYPDPDFDITVLRRASSQISDGDNLSLGPAGSTQYNVKEIDFSQPSTLREAVADADVVVSALHAEPSPTYDNVLLVVLLEVAQNRSNGQRPILFITGYTLDTLHPCIDSAVADQILGPKRRFARRLKASVEVKTGLACCTLVTAGFLDYILPKGYAGFDFVGCTATLWDEGMHQVTGCTLEFVGSCVVEVCRLFFSENPDLAATVSNKRVEVAEVTYSGLEILKHAERAVGRTFEVTPRSTADCVQQAQELMARGESGAATSALFKRLVWGGEGPANLAASGLRFGQQRLKRKTLEEVVERAVEEASAGCPSFASVGR